MKKKVLKSRIIRVPILNDEYSVLVCYGDREAVVHQCARYIGDDVDGFRKQFNQKRGMACNSLLKSVPRHPIIALDGGLLWWQAMATLAHESSHCAQYLMDFIGMSDPSDEFRAHAIGAIMRKVGKELAKKL